MIEWTPFERADTFRTDPVIAVLAKAHGLEEEIKEIYVNNLYQVSVLRNLRWGADGPKLIRLSIKRRDKKALHDWRDLQRIKNELVGEENEAIELYPAESRLVDTANQYWLWVLENSKERFPFGFVDRWVSNVSENGTVQRPFPLERMPKDCRTFDQYRRDTMAKVLKTEEVHNGSALND